MAGFKDHFSAQAELYAEYRPRYPKELFRWLAGEAGGHALAWDCGTGNGQAAGSLASHFETVIATDPSVGQLARARPVPGVEYRAEAAEASSLGDVSADLVFVGQALHWFDLSAFYREVRRVLRPSGLLAAVTYGMLRVEPAIDDIIGNFYRDIVGPWWPPERQHVEDGYARLPFPFKRIEAPSLEMRCEWNLAALTGYLASWSATRRCLAETGVDPLDGVKRQLAGAWGEPDIVRRVVWPLMAKVGRG